MGLLRLLTNAKVFPSDAHSVEQAWNISNEVLADRRVFFEYEPPDLETEWRAMMRHRSVGPSSWTDAFPCGFLEAVWVRNGDLRSRFSSLEQPEPYGSWPGGQIDRFEVEGFCGLWYRGSVEARPSAIDSRLFRCAAPSRQPLRMEGPPMTSKSINRKLKRH